MSMGRVDDSAPNLLAPRAAEVFPRLPCGNSGLMIFFKFKMLFVLVTINYKAQLFSRI